MNIDKETHMHYINYLRGAIQYAEKIIARSTSELELSLTTINRTWLLDELLRYQLETFDRS